MIIDKTKLPWVLTIQFPHFCDNRGSFTKSFHAGIFADMIGYIPQFKEWFFTKSQKNVIRGMHFQLPPSAVDKLVYVSSWIILDVVLDLRKDSWTYGEYIKKELNDENNIAIFIPKWLAHGFLSLSDTSTVHYLTTEVYDPVNDTWISWDSFGYDWEWVDPIISGKDAQLGPLKDFSSPFNINN